MLSAFGDGTLFGERHGSAPARVVALHGWARTHRDFDQVLSPTGGLPVNSIALDLPGFGATPAPDHALSSYEFARIIAPVLEETTEPVVLVGHSHGGRVALALAAIHPEKVRGIVLVGAPVLKRTASKKPSLWYRLARVANKMHLISDQRFEKRRRNAGSADYNAAQGVLRDTLVTVINESFDDELQHLSCPVILVWGAEDHDVPLDVAQRAQAMIGSALESNQRGSADLVVREGVGHLIPTVDPQSVRDAIEELLS